MKRTFITVLSVASLVGLVGCAKNDMLKAPVGREMGFSTYVAGSTKGDVKDAFVIGDQFAVMATQSGNPWTAGDADWYMGGPLDPNTYVAVTNTPISGGSAWKYNPIKLWPANKKVSFFAFSPVPVAAGNDYGITNVVANSGSPTLDFEVDADIKSQVDLLRAEALDKFEEDVQLDFSHALTRVSFAAKANVSSNQMVRLDKIELVGIKNKGTLKLYDDTRVVGAADDMGGWVTTADVASYSPALSHEVVGLVPEDMTAMTQEDQGLFMIPQEFVKGGDAKLKVEYSYSNDGGRRWVNNSKFEIDLGDYTQYWNPSKNYRYILTLSPANVYSFQASVVEWESTIEVNVKNPFSVSLLDIDPTGGKPHEVVVTETRGLELGYTLKSSAPTWITISDTEAGTYAGEVEYKSDGTVTTKIYDKEKKWYIKVLPNTTGAPREGIVTLTREGMDPQEIKVKQFGANPFKDVALPTYSGYSNVHKVEGMIVPNVVGLTYKLKTTSTWYTLSLDGVGNGVKELDVAGSDTPVVFYIHTLSDTKRVARNADLQFETTNSEGVATILGTLNVKQAANTEYYVGRFAGKIKTETVGNETHYYFDKLLFSENTTSATSGKWGPSGITNIRSNIDGKGNTASLVALGTTYVAATQCYNKISTPANQFYLPARDQVVGLFLLRDNSPMNSSTEKDATSSWGIGQWNTTVDISESGTITKDHSTRYRCVREGLREE